MGKGFCTYVNFFIYEMFGYFDLLRDVFDGEYAKVGVGVGRRVSLKFYVGFRLLVDVFDVFVFCR